MPKRKKKRKGPWMELETLTRLIATAEITTSSFGQDGLPERWSAVLVVEGERTSDDREIATNALRWRELPIPLSVNHDRDTHQIVGRIDSITRKKASDGVLELFAEGTFDLGSPEGAEAARQVAGGFLRGVSVELEIEEHEMLEEGECESQDPIERLLDGPGPDCHVIMRVTKGRIMGGSLVSQPAFARAAVVPEGVKLPEGGEDGRPGPVQDNAVISSGGHVDAALRPAPTYFANPELTAPTPLTIDGDLVYGHIATFDSCHTGFDTQCLVPPRSNASYSYFLTGEIVCDDDSRIPVGQLTIGCGHAPLSFTPAATIAHYDGGPGAIQWADVNCGEDAFGIWVSGRVRPGISDTVLRAAQATAPSGDWRKIAGSLELVAITQVPVPGYPIPREVITAAIDDYGMIDDAEDLFNGSLRARLVAGETVALVAAGMVKPIVTDPRDVIIASLVSRIEKIERFAEAFEPQYRDSLLAAIRS